MLTPWCPLGYKVAHFRQARRLPLAGLQAAGPLWEFRWGSALGLCYITRITLKGVQIASATAGQELRFNVTLARNFTAADTTNTASILRAGNMQKLNTAFAASLLSDFRETNSATAPTGGTYTQDTDPVAIGSYVTLTTASTTNDGSAEAMIDYTPYWEGDQLIRLNKNEGFLVNLEAAVAGAASGFILYLEVCWAEATKP